MPFSWARATSLVFALGLAVACSKAEPAPRAVLGEEELGAPGAGGASGCASDADCSGPCFECNLAVTPHQCEARPSGTVCAPATGAPCDAPDTCNNVGVCQPQSAPNNTPCGPAPTGACDAQDTCNNNGTCVPRSAPSGTLCGSPPNGTCDLQDTCNNNGVCQPNLVAPGTLCGDQTNNPPCNLRNTCNQNGQCVDNFGARDLPCGDPTDNTCNHANTCDGSGTCQDNFASRGTTCGTNTDVPCNHPDSCDGSGNCSLNYDPQGTPCNDPTDDPCKDPDSCDANGFCRSNDPVPTAPCDDGIRCTVGDHCSGTGTCVSGAEDTSVCHAPCTDLTVPGCCATWQCDENDTDPVSQGCVFVPLPANSTVCRPSRSACDAPELCSGTKDCPSDLPRGSTYQCQAPMCTDDVARPKVTCDGTTFDCGTQKDCGAYRCNASSDDCRNPCTSSADCLAAYYCNTRTGECDPRTPGGDPCDDASTCATQFCVDGVCCDARCNGQCEACDIRGSEGVCSPIAEGGDPADYGNEPCATDGGECGGACDGETTDECAYPSRTTPCNDPSCDPVRNEATPPSFCDGGGSCTFEDPVSCAPYACGADACNGDCTVDSQCDAASYCQSGVCRERRDTGDRCTNATQCRSGFCVDGVCCESSCQGQCEECNGTSGAGVCAAASGSPVGDRPACTGAEPCAGSCDGSRRDVCVYPGRETSCGEASCLAGQARLEASCDGRGSCPPAEMVQCPKGCEGIVCAGDACVVDSDCPSGARCAAGTCVPRGGPGATCARSGDCASGHCVDGVCCQSACQGQCEACDVSGSEGRCVPVPEGEGPHGARTACVSDGSACSGACDGATVERCAYPEGNRCRAPSCGVSNGRSVATLEALCAGTGRCPAEEQQACPTVCTANNRLCEGGCSSDPDACPRNEYCSAGVCQPERPTGGSCTSASQCASGFCVDGFCCATACDGTCEACDVPGSIGTCTAAFGAPHAGRPACAGTGLCAASCDGSTRAACVFPAEGTACGSESCSNGAHSDGASCDGAGECVDARATACPATECVGNQCGSGCESDADCTGDNVCEGGRCKRSPILDAVDRGTCGCRVPGGRSSNAGALAVVLGLALLGIGRRSRRAA